MNAIIHDKYGSSDVLKLQEVEKPVTGDDDVLVNVHAPLESRQRVARGCAIAAAVLFSTLASFQAALAMGLPWGEAAWGGGTLSWEGGCAWQAGCRPSWQSDSPR